MRKNKKHLKRAVNTVQPGDWFQGVQFIRPITERTGWYHNKYDKHAFFWLLLFLSWCKVLLYICLKFRKNEYLDFLYEGVWNTWFLSQTVLSKTWNSCSRTQLATNCLFKICIFANQLLYRKFSLFAYFATFLLRLWFFENVFTISYR